MDASERFEHAAEIFRDASGYPAIGKDAGPEYGGQGWEAERSRLWRVFRAGYDCRMAQERSDTTRADTSRKGG